LKTLWVVLAAIIVTLSLAAWILVEARRQREKARRLYSFARNERDLRRMERREKLDRD
jgi:hypothetical protein